MSSQQKKNTFFGGAAILAVGAILVKLIGAPYKILLGNILSNEAFTDFNTAYNVYNLFLTVSTAGLPVALSKTVSEANALGRRNQVHKVFRVALSTFFVLGLVSFLCMSVFGGPLAAAMGDPAAIYCVRALSVSVLCVCCCSAFRGYAQGHSYMLPSSISQIIEASCKLVFGLALAFAVIRFLPGEPAYRQQMAAAGAIFGVSIGSVFSVFYLAGNFRKTRQMERRAAKDRADPSGVILSRLLKLAIPITLGSAAVSIVTLIDTRVVLTLLKQMYTDLPELIPEAAYEQTSFEVVEFAARGLKGIYDKCMAVYNLPSALMVPLTASIIPAVSACRARRDFRGASRISESAMRVGALLCLPMGVGLFALGGPIVQLLYPNKLDLAVAGPLMSTLGLAAIFVCIMLICNAILQANGMVNLPVLNVIIGGIIKVVVNYLLVGNYDINIKGAPVGTLCCFAFVSAMDLFIIHRVIPAPPRFIKVFAKPVLASMLMGGSAWACYGLLARVLGGTGPADLTTLGNAIATACAIGAGVVVYLVLVLALRVISKEDLDLMPKGDKIARILHIQ
ncbi:polysaccharide biosynthesis protein [Pseudoflavonifractor sp. 524-17]|uniref:putative polysaccharide biosynthesis protein n=1 Tax=Pseudoflavonifractor sp. 524-17 TaxID=2304577 RepID=UPI001379653B|nr:polysaccharide biosynthesis protein [Pseudoflavonifractor sp. 524-17]NCE63495.1 polysaccharide biosynthesis protein [Pseudoflavonifractor sp. 524-17]